jgi:hypothetical protein
MQKKAIIFLAAVLCVLSTRAQKETKKFSAGFGIEVGAPTGDGSNVYNSAFGLTIRLSWKAGPGFATLTSGAIGFAPKSISGVQTKVGLEIPVRVGYKYIIQHHLFLMGEAGYSDFNSYYGQRGHVTSTSTGSFIFAPSFGYQANVFEIGLRYEMASWGGVAGIRLGFNF